MATISTTRRTPIGGIHRFSTNTLARKAKQQGNPVTLAAIREAKEGKMTGIVDTTSHESFIKTCSE